MWWTAEFWENYKKLLVSKRLPRRVIVRPNIAVEYVEFFLRILEVQGSNLGSVSDYLDLTFFVVFLSTSMQNTRLLP
jgi:hypothetical protein